MLFTIAQRVVHSGIDECSWPSIISQVLLIMVNANVNFRLSIVKVVQIRIVGKATVSDLDAATN